MPADRDPRKTETVGRWGENTHQVVEDAIDAAKQLIIHGGRWDEVYDKPHNRWRNEHDCIKLLAERVLRLENKLDVAA